MSLDLPSQKCNWDQVSLSVSLNSTSVLVLISDLLSSSVGSKHSGSSFILSHIRLPLSQKSEKNPAVFSRLCLDWMFIPEPITVVRGEELLR